MPRFLQWKRKRRSSLGTVDMRFVIIHAGGPNGKYIRSNRGVEEGTGASPQGSRKHRRGFGSSVQQQLEAHDLSSEPEEDGGSAESKVGESEARVTTRCQ